MREESAGREARRKQRGQEGNTLRFNGRKKLRSFFAESRILPLGVRVFPGSVDGLFEGQLRDEVFAPPRS
ncbi:hypothetical protein FQA47_025341 [Oryzias melastigma]|uniref:Uncharacterized protein n=1 Tax=Oryzias melastigma TaxID=30732 RepID=A0A834FSL1_ORYME|nr:hypothetical protein FQA47_025341 [Oryzias melastigma]